MRRTLGLVAIVGGVLLAAPPAHAHDEEPLSEFGVRTGVALGPLIEVGGDFAAAMTTARLREDPTVRPSSVIEMTYRRRTEFDGGRALLVGGDVSLVRAFTATRHGAAWFASGACGSGQVRHDEDLDVEFTQAGVLFAIEWREPIGGAWFVEGGGGFGFYRMVASATVRHQEWCALDSPPATTAFSGVDARDFGYAPGAWVGLTLGWHLTSAVPILDLRLTARYYLVEGYALRLQSQTSPTVVDLHVQPSYAVFGLTVVLTF